MELLLFEVGKHKLDTQHIKVTFEGSLEEYKVKTEEEIEENGDLVLIESTLTYGNDSLLIKYYSKKMDKIITSYAIPITDI